MPATLDLAPAHTALAAGLREVGLMLDGLQGLAEEPADPSAYAGLIAEAERLGRRVDALKLRIVASAERSTVAADTGFSGTDAWLARQTRATRGESARTVHLAESLDTDCPATRTALDRGDLSAAHAAVVVQAVGQLPPRLSPAQRSRVESDLVVKAERFDPAQLRRIARRALAAVEPDPDVVDAHEDTLLRTEEETALSKARLTLHDNDDGTVSGRFTVPSLAGAILRKALDSMTAPRRDRGGRPAEGPEDWSQRRGAAFTTLLEHLPTDRLHSKVAATVVAHLSLDALRGALRAAHLDTGERLSAGAVRRLACQSGILPLVLGGASHPLDLGRSQRLFNEAQRVALSARHTACAASGCERPFAWCELHHRKPWSQGGRTDLADAVPLCHQHHRRIHDPGFAHRMAPDGLVFHRRT